MHLYYNLAIKIKLHILKTLLTHHKHCQMPWGIVRLVCGDIFGLKCPKLVEWYWSKDMKAFIWYLHFSHYQWEHEWNTCITASAYRPLTLHLFSIHTIFIMLLYMLIKTAHIYAHIYSYICSLTVIKTTLITVRLFTMLMPNLVPGLTVLSIKTIK